MSYKNLTPEQLARARAHITNKPDGTWPNWPPVEPKRKKRRGRARTPTYRIARSFKAGSGRYS